MIRRAALAVLGFLAGAVAGLVAIAVITLVWFQVQPMVAPGVTVGTSLDWLLWLGIALIVAGGGPGAWWLLRRSERQQPNAVVLAGVGLVALIGLALFVLTYFGLGF